MHRIVAFLLKQYTFILFVILEVVALSLVVHHNSYHQSAYRKQVSDLSGGTYAVWSAITGYFNLRSKNKELAEENALLHSRLPESFRASDKKIFVWNDTIYHQQFQYVSARIVNASVNKKKNFIIIDKGSNQGIANDMGVISPDGIVGMVRSVSDNYSLIIPLINIDASVAARLKRSDQKGIVSWDGRRFSHALMKGVPGHVELTAGDTVITSGQSIFFPEGILVGYITGFTKNRSDNFYNIQLRLATDFNSLNHVYIIRNLMADEQIKLLNMTRDEQ
jgi:rod shape-determining protein MreC